MPTYESSGSLTTIEKTFDTPQTPDLSGLVYTLNGETISVDVVGSPGTVSEEIASQSLGGASSYDLSWTDSHSDFEVVFNLSTADTSTTPQVDDLTLTGGPDAPSNLAASQGSAGEVDLSWTDNATTEDGYYVYRAQDSGSTTGDYTRVADLPADTTAYTDTGLSDGESYYYRVSAYSTGGESPLSNEDSATTVLPPASNLATGQPNSTSVPLTWTVNTDSGSQSVEYKESSASTWTTYSSGLALSTTSETVTGLTPNTSYDFRVATTTTDAGTVYSMVVTDATTLPAPTDLVVTSVTSMPEVSLSWSNQSGEDEYRIYRSTSPGTTLGDYTQIDTVGVDTTTYTDTTVALGTRYYYVVTAWNTNGESPPSGEVRAEPNSDDLTETVSWDSEREWGYGSFTDTTTDGLDGVTLAVLASVDFNYSIEHDVRGGNESTTAEIRDASSGTVLYTDTVEDQSSASGTWTVDTTQHPDLEFFVEVTDGNGSASITDEFGYTVISTGSGSQTVQQDYRYAESGAYTTEEWDYTNTTTVSKLSYNCTIPSGDSLSFEIRDDEGTTVATVNATDGANSTLVEVPADDRYSVHATLSNATNTYDTTPVIHSLTLEAHTQPTGLTLSNTTATSVDIDWTPVSVADNHILYRSESTPITDADTLIAETNTPPVTDTGLENGEQYYYSVRAEYTGE